MIPYADCARDDEIHFEYFFFFIINDIFVVFFAKVARFEAKSDIIKEFAVFVLLRVEEKAEIVENVIK